MLALSSDIGLYIAREYQKLGFKITGTYRTERGKAAILQSIPDAELVFCDVASSESVDLATSELRRRNLIWEMFVSCPCDPAPLIPFSNSSADEWEKSFYLNSLGQLRFLRGIYSIKSKTGTLPPQVIFFAGGGVNGAVEDFSAYTSAKILLVKMTELLAFENDDCKFTILGPGWTNTKTHEYVLSATDKNSKKHKEVQAFLQDPTQGTPLDDIFSAVDWVFRSEINVVSGRNFSVRDDPWGTDPEELKLWLSSTPDAYKLRRWGNEFLRQQGVYNLRERDEQDV